MKKANRIDCPTCSYLSGEPKVYNNNTVPTVRVVRVWKVRGGKVPPPRDKQRILLVTVIVVSKSPCATQTSKTDSQNLGIGGIAGWNKEQLTGLVILFPRRTIEQALNANDTQDTT